MHSSQITETKKPPCGNARRLGGFSATLLFNFVIFKFTGSITALTEINIAVCSYGLMDCTLGDTHYLRNLFLGAVFEEFRKMNIGHI